MIEIVEGRGVGAGKSYYIATRIITHLAVGGTVVVSTNYGIVWDALHRLICDRYGVEIVPAQLIEFDAKDTNILHQITPMGTAECPVLIVLDEAQSQLNSRDWADNSKRAFFLWLTQSRHDDCDVIFSTQNAANIDKQICRLVTYIVRLRNMANFSIPGLGNWPLKQFVVNRYDGDGKTLHKRIWLKHDKGIFTVYRSKVMRGAHKRNALEVPKHNLKKARKKRPMKLILILIIGGMSFAGYRLFKRFGPKDESAVPAAATMLAKVDAPKERVALPVAATAPPPRPRPAYDVLTEELRGTDGRTYLRTTAEHYTVGGMSSKGFVVGLKEYTVRITTPEGRTLFVVGAVVAQKAGAVTIAPVALPTATFASATWEPRESPLHDEELARKRAWLAAPIGQSAAPVSRETLTAARPGSVRKLPGGARPSAKMPAWQRTVGAKPPAE